MPLLEMIGKLQELCPQCYQKSLWFYRNYRKNIVWVQCDACGFEEKKNPDKLKDFKGRRIREMYDFRESLKRDVEQAMPRWKEKSDQELMETLLGLHSAIYNYDCSSSYDLFASFSKRGIVTMLRGQEIACIGA